MGNTLALWYEPSFDAALPDDRPEVELHFNLWRDLPTWINWLDVGLKIRHPVRFSRFYLYVPARLSRAHVSDLSQHLRVGKTLNAVFNDVVTLGAETDICYQVTPRGASTFTIFKADHDDLEVEDWQDAEDSGGSRIVFTERFCDKLATATTTHSYIRIRIALTGPAADVFSSEIEADDKMFQSAVERLELTEFRLNERRSYPPRIAELSDQHFFKITAVQYFLIRSLGHQLLEQHAPFRKVRRLEPDLWTSYLSGGDSAKSWALKPSLVARFVIYHWKAAIKEGPTTAPEGIKDFIAYASFRTSTAGLLLYATVIVILGAGCNFLANAALYFLTVRNPSFVLAPAKADGALQVAISNVELFCITLVAIAIIAVWVTFVDRQKRRIREFLRDSRMQFGELRRRWFDRSKRAA
jgi:hypothetical protein